MVQQELHGPEKPGAVNEVGDVGRQITKQLNAGGIHSALDWVNKGMVKGVDGANLVKRS